MIILTLNILQPLSQLTNSDLTMNLATIKGQSVKELIAAISSPSKKILLILIYIKQK